MRALLSTSASSSNRTMSWPGHTVGASWGDKCPRKNLQVQQKKPYLHCAEVHAKAPGSDDVDGDLDGEMVHVQWRVGSLAPQLCHGTVRDRRDG